MGEMGMGMRCAFEWGFTEWKVVWSIRRREYEKEGVR
jgi:hypothetical protein